MTDLYTGASASLQLLQDDVYQIVFDADQSKVNTLGSATMSDLSACIDQLNKQSKPRGLVIRSAKPSGFIVGADINEFTALFAAPEGELKKMLVEANALFNRIEDLDCPSIALVHGDALGGGCELALACDFRVIDGSAKMGLPEVQLGIMPGWGGSVRLPRLIGYDNGIEWIATGARKSAKDLLAYGVADALVDQADWDQACLELVADCENQSFDVAARRRLKCGPMQISDIEKLMATEAARGMILAKAGRNYPAPPAILKTLEQQTSLSREPAQALETNQFCQLAKTPVAKQLVGVFLKNQTVKRDAKKIAKSAAPVNRIGVLGAGIMGGGIAYQSASRSIPAVMKDIADDAIEKGLAEAQRLVGGQVARGRMDARSGSSVLQAIAPAKSYGEFESLDLVVEAVTENPKVKAAVLAEAEQNMRDDAVLASNTSTISITSLAKSVKRPEMFLGMHFFNPVHRMPLVEVIRGEKTNETAVATTVSLALAMGKTPIVVNDCPGFLVNRCLFPYYGAFDLLLKEGFDYRVMDKAVNAFGWPMGPAHLADVIGLDTMIHASDVMAEGFPDRMLPAAQTCVYKLTSDDRLGQKNLAGFYDWSKDRKGKLKQASSDRALALVYDDQAPNAEIDPTLVNNRLMTAFALEAIRCLQDNIVANASELDIAMLYGLGFPPHLGGPMAWVDAMGSQAFLEMAQGFESLGGLYAIPDLLASHASNNQPFITH